VLGREMKADPVARAYFGLSESGGFTRAYI
jgi:hypothetical protein